MRDSLRVLKMNVGYARVSSKDQNLDRQIAALNDAGVERTFADKQSGKDFERVEYKAMMKRHPPRTYM